MSHNKYKERLLGQIYKLCEDLLKKLHKRKTVPVLLGNSCTYDIGSCANQSPIPYKHCTRLHKTIK